MRRVLCLSPLRLKLSSHHFQPPNLHPGNKSVSNRYFSESNSSASSTIPKNKTTLNQDANPIPSNANSNLEVSFSTFLRYLSVGLIGFVGAFLTNYSQIKEIFGDADKMTQKFLSSIQNSQIDFRLKDFQDRSALLETIKSSICTDEYLIVYGPKGAGKSTLVDYALKDQKGVVKILLSSAISKEQIIEELNLQILGMEKVGWSLKLFIDKIKSLTEPPTIVFEIERSKTQKISDLDSVRSLCKILIGSAKCIIVLSEANAILHFGQDPGREKVVYVGEFSPQEARDYLRLRGVELTPKQMEYVVSQVGTMPIRISRLAKYIQSTASKNPNSSDRSQLLPASDETVEEFVRSELLEAWDQISRFPDKSLLQQLKQSPRGVPSDGINVKELMLINETNVITRNLNKRLVLQSTAHKTALEKYDCSKKGQNNPFEK